jgi:3-phenylpropionate/trans-cinnamate dioxygenase ferredoxin subunit
MNTNGRWIPVVKETGLVNNRAKAAGPPGPAVLIIRQEGALYAIENRCPHLSCPLDRGSLEGFQLTCPCHDWVFDIRTGEFILAPEIKLKTYTVKMEKGMVYIRITD